jgi:hypothetical protein
MMGDEKEVRMIVHEVPVKLRESGRAAEIVLKRQDGLYRTKDGWTPNIDEAERLTR